jgi:hypothetical protein
VLYVVPPYPIQNKNFCSSKKIINRMKVTHKMREHICKFSETRLLIIQNIKRTPTTQQQKSDLNRHFSKEDKQMAKNTEKGVQHLLSFEKCKSKPL